jgi:glycerol-3-phosphate dehydrogenase subunit B
MLIVGFEGYRDFYPRLIAENLTRQGVAARAAFLSWETLTDQIDRNNAHLAAGLDEPGRAARLAQALRPLVQPGERIGLPAILGLARHAEIVAELEAVTGAAVFEIPTLPPSIPGMRLYHALRERLFARSVRVETNMEVIGFQAQAGDPKRIEWVETETSARPLRHRAQAFLLATGGVLGGGFQSDHTGRFWETVFGLPLTVSQERRAWFRPQFLDPEGQPVFRGGVRVDARFQPLHEEGAPVYANLWAAGGALAEADPILERSLEGIAIATGMAVAERVAGERTAVTIG